MEFEHTGPNGPYKIVIDEGREADRVWGIERNPLSPQYGSKVVPVFILWRRPGVDLSAGNITGCLQHGDEVEIIRHINRDGETFYFVKAKVVQGNNTYLQKGWIVDRLLERAGKAFYEGLAVRDGR